MKKELMDNPNNQVDEKEALSLQDLLDDQQEDILSEYVSLSLTNQGENTQVSVTTVEDSPTTYLGTLWGVSLTDLQLLDNQGSDGINE